MTVETTRSGDLRATNVTTTPKAAFTYARSKAPVTTKNTAVMAVAPEPAGPSGIPFNMIIYGAVTVVLAGTGFWYIRRWWRYRQNPALFEEY